MHQSQQLTPAPFLARVVTSMGGARRVATILKRDRSLVTLACHPNRPSLPPDLLRQIAPDHPTLLALFHDRAARLTPPTVEIPYTKPGDTVSDLAIILQANAAHGPTAVAALRAHLATLPD